MSIDTGEIVGLIGPNGSGKTTLFNCISGFYQPDEGRVLLEGEECTHFQPHQIAKRGISRTFQLAKLFYNLPVIENVMLARHLSAAARSWRGWRDPRLPAGGAAARREAQQLLDLAGLNDHQDRIAANCLTAPAACRSGDRLQAAEAVILLLDQPTAGMNLRKPLAELCLPCAARARLFLVGATCASSSASRSG